MTPSEEKDVRETIGRLQQAIGHAVHAVVDPEDLRTTLVDYARVLAALQSAEQERDDLRGENGALDRARAVGMERICDLEAERDKLAEEVERLTRVAQNRERAEEKHRAALREAEAKLASLEREAYQRGWNDRESDFLERMDRIQPNEPSK